MFSTNSDVFQIDFSCLYWPVIPAFPVTVVCFVGCRLQKQHDGFRDWLQTKEKQSVEVDRVRALLKELQDER